MTGQEGAGFVLVNPLHAAEPRPPVEDSPYLPTTRRYFNPLYLRVEEIPEYGYLDPAGRAEVERLAGQQHSANHSTGLLDRNSSYGAKLAALELLFAVRRGPARSLAFADFCAGEGQGLDDFALWCALAEKLAADGARVGGGGLLAGDRLLPGAAARCWQAGSSSTAGCSGSATSSSRPPSARPAGRAWKSASSTTSPWA